LKGTNAASLACGTSQVAVPITREPAYFLHTSQGSLAIQGEPDWSSDAGDQQRPLVAPHGHSIVHAELIVPRTAAGERVVFEHIERAMSWLHARLFVWQGVRARLALDAGWALVAPPASTLLIGGIMMTLFTDELRWVVGAQGTHGRR
jgi:hypothetical protein